MYNQANPYELTPMEKFVVQAEKRTMEALARTDEVQELFKSVLAYFGEDPAMNSVDFFGTLNKFVGALDGAYEVVKRLEAQRAAEERKAAAHRAREEKKAQAQKEKEEELSGNASSAIMEKGKLDLSGQRKQFADPFAGPDKQDDVTEPESNALTMKTKPFADPFVEPSSPHNAQDENDPNSISTNTSSSPTKNPKDQQSLKFFPATSPGANESPSKSPSMKFFPATSPVSEEMVDDTSSRTQRYNNKTSFSARTNEGETNQDPRAALIAMLSKRKHSPTQTESEVGKVKEAASKEIQDDAQSDPRAALSAMLSKRNSVPAKEAASPVRIEVKEESIKEVFDEKDKQDHAKADPRAALMAMLSKRNPLATEEPSAPHSKKECKVEDNTQTGGPNHALHENHNTSDTILPDSLNMPSFDTAPSSEEPPKVHANPSHNNISVANEKQGNTNIPSNATPVNIAAMAAAAAKKKSASKESSTPSSSSDKRKTKSKFSDAGSSAPMGIAAMAAAAARQKILLKEAINECDTSDLSINEASTTSNHLKCLIEASNNTDDIDEA